jgi:hypothetical protein
MEDGGDAVPAVDAAEEQTGGASSSQAPMPKIVAIPTPPNELQRRTHNPLHLPHADWCDVCIKARGRDYPHRMCDESTRLGLEADGLTEAQSDYAQIGDLTILS